MFNSRKSPFVCFAVAVMILISIFTGCSSSLLGSWHNEQLNQLLRFYDDGTVLIKAADGDHEATYVFDKSKKEGVITLNGTAIGFLINGDEMKVSSNDTENLFVRGDMEIAYVAAESVSSENTSVPSAQPSETSVQQPDGQSDESTASDSSSGSGSSTVPPIVVVNPGISKNVLGNILYKNIYGNWSLGTDAGNYFVTFYEDGRYIWTVYHVGDSESTVLSLSTYTYNPTTGTGEARFESSTVTFSMNGGDLIWFGNTYHR